jgi:hypothetical protein
VAGFTVTISSRDADVVARELAAMPKRIPQAMASAINKTMARLRTVIADGIKDATTLKRGRILKGTNLYKASPQKLSARVTFKGRQIGAIQFKNSVSKKRGVKVTFMRGDSPVHFRHGFKGVGKSGNEHLFLRARKGGKPVPRLPIENIYGPNLGTIYAKNPHIEANANKLANEIIRKELESQVNRFLGRKKS